MIFFVFHGRGGRTAMTMSHSLAVSLFCLGVSAEKDKNTTIIVLRYSSTAVVVADAALVLSCEALGDGLSSSLAFAQPTSRCRIINLPIKTNPVILTRGEEPSIAYLLEHTLVCPNRLIFGEDPSLRSVLL